jgi:hypothetical protein
LLLNKELNARPRFIPIPLLESMDFIRVKALLIRVPSLVS